MSQNTTTGALRVILSLALLLFLLFKGYVLLTKPDGPLSSLSEKFGISTSIPSSEIAIKKFYETIVPGSDDDSIPQIESFFSFMVESSDFEKIREDNSSLLTTLMMKQSSEEMQARMHGAGADGNDLSQKLFARMMRENRRQSDMMQVIQAFANHQHSIINKGEGLNTVVTHIKEQKKHTAIVDAVLTFKNGDTHTETFRLVRMGGKDDWKRGLILNEAHWDEEWRIVAMDKKEMYAKGYMQCVKLKYSMMEFCP